jgi:hypothetical protein
MGEQRRRERAQGLIPGQSVSGLPAINIDTAKAVQPPLAGFADRCAIRQRGIAFDFVFFEELRPGERVVIARFAMTKGDVIERIWKPSRGTFFRTLVGSVPLGERVPLSEEFAYDVSGPALQCNVMVMSQIGASALIDCYFVNAASLNKALTTRSMATPISLFSIQLPSGLLVSVLEFAQHHSPEDLRQPTE